MFEINAPSTGHPIRQQKEKPEEETKTLSNKQRVDQ